MKLGIMQPYLFPYLGYFQLIQACDKFVIHDDVQYIRQGWVNRNRILVHGKEYLFTFSVTHDDYSKAINQRYYTGAFETEVRKLLRNIDQSYSKSPGFDSIRALLVRILTASERNVSKFNILSIQAICQYLGIDTEILVSSDLSYEKSLTAESRVLAINQLLGSTHYINPVGGLELYSKEAFLRSGVQLSFLQPTLRPYQQPTSDFYPGLSVIDTMMNCSRDDVRDMLGDFALV